MKKMISCLTGALLILSVATGCTSSTENARTPGTGGDMKEQKFVTIATGGSSGPYYTLGGALARIYQEKLGYHTSVQSTDGTVENINLLKAKKADIAFGMSDVASFAYKGEENFKDSGPVTDLKAIAGLYLNYVQIIALKEKNIKSVADLKGKRVGVGAPNSGVEVNARIVLGGHGITYNDIKPDYLSYAEAIEQLKNGTIDASFVTSGLPNSAVIDLSKEKTVEIVPIQAADIEKMTKQFPFFVQAEIPPGVYKNEKPIPTAAIRNILLVRGDLSEEKVYKITKLFFENLGDLQAAHSAAKEIDVNHAWKNLVVPLHPGAEIYYKEVGKL
ncbi:TAXI family TRAP transporter solute-binding subunit [Effusibacillus consociatus]|uniref:TAXI family TRAP transporter solute-binding subunit n=1 Tax=Effusibacillus consociatus TaxID=1117041 RepID=A0ABV9PYP0_9BACL